MKMTEEWVMELQKTSASIVATMKETINKGAEPPHDAIGAGYWSKAGVEYLLGDHEAAFASYREMSRWYWPYNSEWAETPRVTNLYGRKDEQARIRGMAGLAAQVSGESERARLLLGSSRSAALQHDFVNFDSLLWRTAPAILLGEPLLAVILDQLAEIRRVGEKDRRGGFGDPYYRVYFPAAMEALVRLQQNGAPALEKAAAKALENIVAKSKSGRGVLFILALQQALPDLCPKVL